jgi:hypothetical protein
MGQGGHPGGGVIDESGYRAVIRNGIIDLLDPNGLPWEIMSDGS